MRVVIGVDLGGRYKPALELCVDLAFPEQTLTFVHSVLVIPAYAPPFSGAVMSSHLWMSHLREAATAIMAEAEGLASASGLRSAGIIEDGSAALSLMSTADSQGSDLIAVGSSPKGRFSAFFGGSVARALTIGAQQSILVAKGEASRGKPLRAIFATDHSPYAARALERFCQWNPRGLERIDVLTAYDDHDEFMAAVRLSISDSSEDAGKWLTDNLNESTQKVSNRLREMDYESNSFVLEGHPSTLIGEHMKAREADLLILGAQGHGFIERLLVGSVTLHQILSEPYPVLVIRA